MNRLNKWSLLSIATSIILGATSLVAATTRYVPSHEWPSIQSAINASVAGDIVRIYLSYEDPGFTVNKNIIIDCVDAQYTVTMAGTSGAVPIKISSTCSFQNLAFSNKYTNRDLFQINAGSYNVYFFSCMLNQGSNTAQKSCIYDKGSNILYLDNTILLTGTWGIYGSNSKSIYLGYCNLLWNNKGIEYTQTSSTQGAGSLGFYNSYSTMNSNSNAWIIKTSFPNLANGKYNNVTFSSSNFSAYGSGSVPVILNKHNRAYFSNNSFNNCPTGPRWTLTSTDVIAQNSGNTGCY